MPWFVMPSCFQGNGSPEAYRMRYAHPNEVYAWTGRHAAWALSPNGQWLAISRLDAGIEVYDLTLDKSDSSSMLQSRRARSHVVLPDGIFTGGPDGTRSGGCATLRSICCAEWRP
jgi:hypothetical protein